MTKGSPPFPYQIPESLCPPRVWFITGASSGLGKALAEVALHKGDIVVATLRKPDVLASLIEQYSPSRLLVLTLDVTRPSDISAAFSRTREVFGYLDVVFNNAGHGMLCEVEGTPEKDARALFEVNFWGLVGISREAVRFFRDVNPPGRGGTLLQNSSMMSFCGDPGVSFYSASKHAVDGFSESLSKELPRDWNIKICILQTGGFDTNVIAGGKIPPIHPAYKTSVTSALRHTYPKLVPSGDPYKFAKTLHRLIEGVDDGIPLPLFLPIGKDALERLQIRVEKMGKLLADATPWSADLQKDDDKNKARL